MLTAKQIVRGYKTGIYLFAGGGLFWIALAMFSVFQDIGYLKDINDSAMTLSVTWAFVVTFILWLMAAILWGCRRDEALLIRRWDKIVGGQLEGFPLTSEERLALTKWAKDSLEGLARNATRRFSDRDQAKQKFEEFSHTRRPSTIGPLEGPYRLISARDKLRQQQEDYDKMFQSFLRQKNTAWCDAEHAASLYNIRWDLFKDMKIRGFLDIEDMLPINPKTEKPWEDPNAFRLSLEARPSENT